MKPTLTLIGTGMLFCTTLIFGQPNAPKTTEMKEEIRAIVQNPDLTSSQKKALITEAMEHKLYGDKLPGALPDKFSTKKALASPRLKIANPEGMMALDSIVDYDAEGIPTGKTWYRYDREGNNARIYTYANQEGRLNLYSYRHLYYDIFENIISDSIWNIQDNQFILTSICEDRYDENNDQNYSSCRFLSFGVWEGYKEIFKVENGLDIIENYAWDPLTNDWTPMERTSRQRDEHYRIILELNQRWDNTTASWYDSLKHLTSYQPNGHLLTDSIYASSVPGAPLELVSFYELFKNNNGEDSVGRINTRLSPEEDWLVESVNKFFYDESGVLYTDSTYIQNPADEGWSQRVNLYNEDGLLSCFKELKYYLNWDNYMFDSTAIFYKSPMLDTLSLYWNKLLATDPWTMTIKSKKSCDTIGGLINHGKEYYDYSNSNGDKYYWVEDASTGYCLENNSSQFWNPSNNTFNLMYHNTFAYDFAGNITSIVGIFYWEGELPSKSMLNYTFDYEANINEYLLPSNGYYTYSSIALAVTNYDWNMEEETWEVYTRKHYFYSPFSYQALPVNKAFSAGHLTLYPNPAREAVTIEVPAEGGLMEVLSITGQVIVSQPAEGRVTRLDVSNFKSGLYLVRVTNGNTIYSNRLLVR